MAGTLEVQATWGCRKRRRPDGGRQRRTTTTTTTRDGYDDDGRGRQRRRRSTTTTLTTTTVGEDDDEAHGNDDFRRPRRQHRTAVAAGLLRRGAPLSEALWLGPARGRSAQATDKCAISAIARPPRSCLHSLGPPRAWLEPGCNPSPSIWVNLELVADSPPGSQPATPGATTKSLTPRRTASQECPPHSRTRGRSEARRVREVRHTLA